MRCRIWSGGWSIQFGGGLCLFEHDETESILGDPDLVGRIERRLNAGFAEPETVYLYLKSYLMLGSAVGQRDPEFLKGLVDEVSRGEPQFVEQHGGKLAGRIDVKGMSGLLVDPASQALQPVGHRREDVDDGGQRLPVDLDALGRVLGTGPRVGHDHRHDLADVADAMGGERVLRSLPEIEADRGRHAVVRVEEEPRLSLGQCRHTHLLVRERADAVSSSVEWACSSPSAYRPR